jgi:hypothetical protein
MIRELWYIVTHDPLSTIVLAVALLHALCAILAVVTLRQNLHLQRQDMHQKELVRRLQLRRQGDEP